MLGTQPDTTSVLDAIDQISFEEGRGTETGKVSSNRHYDRDINFDLHLGNQLHDRFVRGKSVRREIKLKSRCRRHHRRSFQ